MAGGVLVPGEEKATETEQKSQHTHKCREPVNNSAGRGKDAGYFLNPELFLDPKASLSHALCPSPHPTVQ